MEAEHWKFYDLAESLYAIAVERDPGHVNNRQCYISFLLDHRADDSSKIQLCGEMLEGLSTTLERQERTRGLKAQYLTILNKKTGQPLDLDELVSDIVGDGEFASIRQATPALSVLQIAGRFEDMRALIEQLRPKLVDDVDDVAVLDRIMADAFAGSGDDQLRDEAIGIYKQLIGGENDDCPDVKHNLATLLHSRNSRDPDGEALKLWSEAYAARPHDTSIRRGLAQYLMRHERQADAANVLEGKPI